MHRPKELSRRKVVANGLSDFDTQLQVEDTEEYQDFLDSQESAQQHQIDGDNALTTIIEDIQYLQCMINKFQEKFGTSSAMQGAVAALATIKNKIAER
jgi:hypothetical protein